MNVFALVVLFLIYSNISRRTDKYLPEQQLFVGMLGANGLLLVLDTAMRLLDGRAGMLARAPCLLFAACHYALTPVVFLLWTFYADYQIYRSEKRLKRLLVPMLIPICVHLALSFLSIFLKLLFYIDADNLLQRGPFSLATYLIVFFYLIYTFIFILWMQNRIQRHTFVPMLTFAIPPFADGIVQILFPGVSMIWIGVTISILIIFMNLQNHQLYTDYLTGLFNRRQLDHFLQQVQNTSDRRLLAGLMIDLNSFKLINDLYGHDAGDRALKQTARILRKTFRKNDFIARYGGDEFVIIMDIREIADLSRAVHRLRENLRQFNAQKAVPYILSLSIGYDIYTPTPGFNLQKFLKHLDDLMYQDKQNHEPGLATN